VGSDGSAVAVDVSPHAAERTASSAKGTSGDRVRLVGVDGLRALAACSILVYHVWMYGSPDGEPPNLGLFNRFVAPHLPVGVTLFFTLSGFLLYRPIVASVLHGRTLPNVKKYLTNRGLRILPAYWFVLAVTAVVLPAADVRLSATQVGLGRLVMHPAELFANAALMQNYFTGSMDSGIGPTWSLAVEVVFYLTLPALGLIAVTIARRSTTRRMGTIAVLAPAALLYGIGLAAAMLAQQIEPSESAYAILVRSFLYHADLFSFGMAFAVLMTCVTDGTLELPRWWPTALTVAFGALVLTTMLLADRAVIPTYQGAVLYETLTAGAAVALLALVVLPRANGSAPFLSKVLDSRIFVAVGLASYSVFLWHEPLIRWLNAAGLTFAGRRGFLVNLAVLSALTGFAAALTYRFIERPALARKRRSTSR
jgi:peptidoglycan/LPS O-acetylase OafA/YrhL